MGADLKVEFKRKKNSVSYEQLNLNLTELSDIAYELDVTPLDEMISIGEEEVEQAAAVEGMTPAAVRKKMVKWFAPEEPLASVEALVAYLAGKVEVGVETCWKYSYQSSESRIANKFSKNLLHF